MNVVTIGVGAGLVSALLIAVLAKATPLALLLFLLAPIPVLVVSLGWNHRSGLVASAVGGIAVALIAGPADGVAYALGTALPAWWLAYLAQLGRPLPDGTIEWYPLGRLLAWIAATAALTYLAAALVPEADFAAYEASSRQAAELLLRMQTGVRAPAPLPNFGEMPASEVIARLADAAPVFAAQGFVVVLLFYVWLSGKIVSVSGRLARPWPYLPATRMPRAVLIVPAAALIGASLLDGFPGVLAMALLGAFSMAFALQGLALIHATTVGRGGRFFVLAGTYLLILMSQGLILLALVLLGLLDTAFDLRARLKPRGKSGPGTPST